MAAGSGSRDELLLDDDENLLAETPPTACQALLHRLDELYGPLPQWEAPNSSWLGKLGRSIGNNWKSGLTVSLISVPLSISLAIANGGTPVMGMVTAVWSGAVAALTGGSDFNIHGPTGALSGIVKQYAVAHGVHVLPFLALLSGLVSLAFFALRLDRYVMFIPSAVMHGFTFGVACIIGLGQLGYALGLPPLPAHVEFYLNVWTQLQHANQLNPWAVTLFVLFLALLFALVSRWPKVPWTMGVAAAGVLLGWLSKRHAADLPWLRAMQLQTLMDRFENMSPDLLQPAFSQWQPAWFLRSELLTAALSVSFISILETLISAKIAERLTNTPFHQPAEVLGLALSNMASGIFGGLPSTAALARTALNIKSGATSRMSGVINAVAVLLISVVLLPIFKYLLLPVIASILVVVAVRMAEYDALLHMYRYDRKMFWLCVLVTFIVILADPTSGIVVGAIVALFMFASHNAKGHGEASIGKGAKMLSNLSLEEVDKTLSEKKRSNAKAFGDTLVYRIPGELTYLNAPSHVERAKRVGEKYSTIILALRYLFYVDIDGLDALGDMVKELEAHGKQVMLAGVHDSVKTMLEKTKWYKEKMDAGYVFPTYRDALAALDEATGAGAGLPTQDDRSGAEDFPYEQEAHTDV